MTSWSERALLDASLAAWRDAEVAQAHVELQALRVEYAHRGDVIESLKAKIAELKAQLRKRTAARTTEESCLNG